MRQVFVLEGRLSAKYVGRNLVPVVEQLLRTGVSHNCGRKRKKKQEGNVRRSQMLPEISCDEGQEALQRSQRLDLTLKLKV